MNTLLMILGLFLLAFLLKWHTYGGIVTHVYILSIIKEPSIIIIIILGIAIN